MGVERRTVVRLENGSPGVGVGAFLVMSVGAQGRLAALDNLRSAAATFNLESADADELILQLQTSVTSSWRNVLGEAGFDDRTLDTLVPSFQRRDGQGHDAQHHLDQPLD